MARCSILTHLRVRHVRDLQLDVLLHLLKLLTVDFPLLHLLLDLLVKIAEDFLKAIEAHGVFDLESTTLLYVTIKYVSHMQVTIDLVTYLAEYIEMLI